MEGMSGFFSDLGTAYKQQRRIQKSNDIITFIIDNWKLFTKTRAEMQAYAQQLGQQLPYTVDALCDQLGIPSFVYFKRSPVADIGGTLLDFENSKLMQLFTTCMNSVPNHEACLFIVAGKKSICITNMQTHFETCKYDFRYWDGDTEIHIFKASEAANRLPNLFNPRENTNE